MTIGKHKYKAGTVLKEIANLYIYIYEVLEINLFDNTYSYRCLYSNNKNVDTSIVGNYEIEKVDAMKFEIVSNNWKLLYGR